MKINIAIDGPSAAGKSTIADILAARLGYVHLDTGAMYRCTAYKAMQNGISLEDEDGVCRMLKQTQIRMTPEGGIFLDGEDVTGKIRTDEISMAASKVSKLKNVRRDLVLRQQEMSAEKGYILDGRDIGTVVLPNAEVKIFLVASAQARAERRWKQNQENHVQSESIEKLKQEIEARDYQDSHRQNSPLKKADDAIEIDSSFLSKEEVTDRIMKLIQNDMNGRKQA